MTTQVDRLVKRVFGTLAFISQDFQYRSWNVMLEFYNTLVLPHLEYCVGSGLPAVGWMSLNLKGRKQIYTDIASSVGLEL